VIKGIKPRDEVEAMLAAQMAAIHSTIMTFTRRLAHVNNLPQQDSAERTLNKLARTFATQMESSDARIITGEDEGAESDALRMIPTQAGQRSDDCGQPIRVG
jgi:hypothetical protein